MPKAISITINTDDVLKAAKQEGFTVSQSEASHWLRENAWAIEEFAHNGLYEFMGKMMRTDFPEESLAVVGRKLASAISDAVEGCGDERNLELTAYTTGEEMLNVVRTFRDNQTASAVLSVDVSWNGRDPMSLPLAVRKEGERYTAEVQPLSTSGSQEAGGFRPQPPVKPDTP